MLGLVLGMAKQQRSLRKHFFFANSRNIDICDLESLAFGTYRLDNKPLPS